MRENLPSAAEPVLPASTDRKLLKRWHKSTNKYHRTLSLHNGKFKIYNKLILLNLEWYIF